MSILTCDWTSAMIDDSVSNQTGIEADLGDAADFMQVFFPTMASATLNIKVATKSGGTFQDLYLVDGDGTPAKVTTDASNTGAFCWTVPLGGWQFVKIYASADQTEDRAILVRGLKV